MAEYSNPEIQEFIGRVIYLWPILELKVSAEHLKEGTAELYFYHANGNGDKLLLPAKVNLLSTTGMNSIERRLEKASKDVPWSQILTKVASHNLEYQRRGEPGEVLHPVGGFEHPGYYVEPLILKGMPSVIYGEKGVNKTTLGLTLLGLIASGIDDATDSPCGLIAPNSARVGMLDWESNKEITLYNISRLIEGGTAPYFEPAYLRCSVPMSDDIDRIANFVQSNKLEILLIDSLGQAAGSDRFDTAGKVAALRFFECLRQLKVTSLLIGQTAKNEEGKRTIYGSVYYQYYARNIFELKGKQDELDNNTMHLALFHTDANYSRKYEPLGFNVTYSDTMIKIESEPVLLSQFLKKASQTVEISELLKSGAKSANTIAKAINIPEAQCRVLLSRLKKRGTVIDLGSGLWGLKSEVECE